MKKIDKVFHHEVGHYIAHQLNFKNFEIGEVEKILIIEKYVRGYIEFEGQTIPKRPHTELRDRDKLVNLPEKIAEIVYGCYIQSLFLDCDFKICFCNQGNGYIDEQMLISGLSEFKIYNDQRKILWDYLRDEYFTALVKKKESFNDLFELNIDDYVVIVEDGKFEIFLNKLDEKLENILINHEPMYLEFLSRIKEIINWDEIKET